MAGWIIAYEENKKSKDNVKDFLKKSDKNFKEEQNDEKAWQVSLNQKQALDVLKKLNVASHDLFPLVDLFFGQPTATTDAELRHSEIRSLS